MVSGVDTGVEGCADVADDGRAGVTPASAKEAQPPAWQLLWRGLEDPVPPSNKKN